MLVDSISNRIQKALSIRGMKQVDLVEKTGISKGSICQYASGFVEPKADRIYLIAKALDVSETWLIGYDVPMEREAERTPENARVLAEVMKDARFMECVKKISALEQTKKEALYSYIDFLSSH